MFYEVYTKRDEPPIFDGFVTEKEVSRFIKAVLDKGIEFEVFTNEVTADGIKLMQIQITDVFPDLHYIHLADMTRHIEGWFNEIQ